MPLGINSIIPALEILSSQVDILPATGGAVEDLQRPDADELEDMLINRENNEITEFAEEPEPSLTTLYRSTPPLFRAERHLFRFFADGSLKTYYLATGIEGNRSFPIELAQIGAAVMQRDAIGKVRPLSVNSRILLLIPRGQFGLSDSVWSQLEGLYRTQSDSIEIIDTSKITETTPQEPNVESLRTRAGGIARNRMHLLEIELANETNGLRSEDNWLILDGGLQFSAFMTKRNRSHVIGVAKSFSKTPRFRFGRKGRPTDITSILAGLPFASRTAVFRCEYQGKGIGFWYVRLREQKEVDYPLMGVVKVEVPLPDDQQINTETVDLLSRALVAERNVTPYGRDSRWHCHLYPIFQAEEAIKNQFYSEQVLMGVVRWPRPQTL